MSEANNAWRVEVDGVEHQVELEHGTIFGSRTVMLDGIVIAEGRKLFDTGSSHKFEIAGQSAEVKIDVVHAGLGHASSLHVAGRFIEPLAR